MPELRQTDSGIYYLHDYIPVRQFRYHSEEEVDMSRKVWDYKNGNADALNLFTNELMQAIAIISNNTWLSKIGLVAVPPSKVDKESTIRTSIWNIKNWYDQGLTNSMFGYSKTIYDYSNLISRVSDISTAHEGRIASFFEEGQRRWKSRNRKNYMKI